LIDLKVMLVQKGFCFTTAAPYTVALVFAAEKGGFFCVSVPVQENGRKGAQKCVSLCIYGEGD
jgi:hypothetical protein